MFVIRFCNAHGIQRRMNRRRFRILSVEKSGESVLEVISEQSIGEDEKTP
ncbi:hypothetical protein [Sphingopyxis sp. 550A]